MGESRSPLASSCGRTGLNHSVSRPGKRSLGVTEAFSVGTPVIGPNRSGFPEIVSRVDGQLVFSLEENDDFLRAFGFLEQNYEGLRKKAILTYQQYFSPECYLTSYAKLL